MGEVLGNVYRAIATHLIQKAGFNSKMAQTGAVTLIQRLDSPLNTISTFTCCSSMGFKSRALTNLLRFVEFKPRRYVW